jgi:hypothetical protein
MRKSPSRDGLTRPPANLRGDNGEPQHLLVGTAVCGPFLCPLVRCFLLLWCHHNGIRAGNHRRQMAGGEPPHHVRRRAVRGVHRTPVSIVRPSQGRPVPLPARRASRLITPRAPSTQAVSNGASGPFMWKAMLDTRVLIAEDLGAAPTPLVLAQVEC